MAECGDTFGACYCKMCQRWSAGMFMGASAGSIEITAGEEALTVFQSSPWAVRAFCNRCGSNLYYHAAKHGGPSVAFGSLDDTSGLTMHVQYFVDQQPEGLALDVDCKTLTSAEIEAMMQAASSGS